ncbi:D-alanyl-D-alanine carboxypeptidase [Heyndrickxia sporothermodurans]|nr:D-alanyl-D-alanine carboxypeptidase [Heyndrickxia sporothermodurans]
MRKIALSTMTALLFLLSGCVEKEKSFVQVEHNHAVSENENTKNQDKQINNQKSSNDSEQKLTNGKQNSDDATKNNGSVPVVSNPASITVMVNKSHALPKEYRANDLVRPKVKFVFGNEKLEKALMRTEAASALEKMFEKAASEGIHLFAASGYRSYETQDYLFKREIDKVGREKAEQAVAYPGTSEHQTGLAMDISAPSVNYTITEKLENKEEGKWLAEHAHEYGFILRYPKGKEEITKYKFEPWHFRYVGKKIASEIYEKGITLEEYFEEVKGI